MTEPTEDFAPLMELSDDELYRRVAMARGMGALDPDPEEAGRAIFSRMLHSSRHAICADTRIQGFIHHKGPYEATHVVAIVLEIALAVFGAHAPGAAGFAILVSRHGLEKLCLAAPPAGG